MQTLWQDLRYGVRSMLKKPAFTLIAVIALALGIGANTAIFSVINSVLLRPLPFTSPERIVMVWNTDEKNDQGSVTYPDFNDWRAQSQSFEYLAAYRTRDFSLTGTGEPIRLRGAMVTADLFPLLGVTPIKGRPPLPEEDKPGARAVILSHNIWENRFGSDPNIQDKTVTIDGQTYNIVGVMPAGFTYPIQNDPQIELWTTTATMQEGRNPFTAQRGNHALHVIGRLKADVTIAQAQAEMSGIVGRLAEAYPGTNTAFGVRIAPLHDELVRDIRRALLILFGAVGCLLLIACANVANLLLARATTRHKEIAIRSALGASRLRVIRQLLTESLLLAGVGGLCGLVLALWGADLLVSIVPKGLPRVSEIGLDARALGFTMLVSLATGLLFGIVPALQIARSDLSQTLKEGGRSSSESGHRNRVRSVLVVAEVAIALMLLVSAGLLINSFFRLQQVKPGFDKRNVLTFRLNLPDARYAGPQKITSFFEQLPSRIEALPGVENVAYTMALPLSGQGGALGFSIEGVPNTTGLPYPYETDYRTVSPGYFRAMGMRLIKGRDFEGRDELLSKPVVIINETLAKRYFPGQDPIGRRINPSFSVDERGALMREIIGVVSDVKHSNLNSETPAEVYIAHKQNPRPNMFLVVRTSHDPTSLINAVRGEVQALDRDLPVHSVKTIDEYLSASVAQPRFNTLLLSIFAAAALILTVVGLYGVLSYSVTQRTHEIGVRLALGARQKDVLRLVVGQGMTLAFIGIALGLIAAFALNKVIEGLLFGVTTTDPLTFFAVSTLLATVALVACYLPARRAAKVDPMVALRYE